MTLQAIQYIKTRKSLVFLCIVMVSYVNLWDREIIVGWPFSDDWWDKTRSKSNHYLLWRHGHILQQVSLLKMQTLKPEVHVLKTSPLLCKKVLCLCLIQSSQFDLLRVAERWKSKYDKTASVLSVTVNTSSKFDTFLWLFLKVLQGGSQEAPTKPKGRPKKCEFHESVTSPSPLASPSAMASPPASPASSCYSE